MKKLVYVFAAFIVIAAVSCKSKKGTLTTKDKDSGMEVLNLPCDDFKTSTEQAFRSTQSQKSSDLSLSREKALVVAKQRLAGLVQTKITSVTDRYVDEYQTNAGLEMKGKFNNLTREIISQQLNDVKILCEKTVREKDGSYTTFVAVEMNKDALKVAMENKLSDKAKVAIDYDKMKFEQIYNEEMKKLEENK
ncbi:MAG: hypothetical protein K9G64_02945 [Bacteroidia bacterium]|nr:hypothetical protein [Bacteroidia bacterium]